jgi:molybdopterin converting factor small subunit
MPTVHIPSLLRGLTGGRDQVDVPGKTVREVIDALDRAYPGLRARLLDGNRLRANVAVAIDGELAPLGLRERLGPDAEIHFVAAIQGGT